MTLVNVCDSETHAALNLSGSWYETFADARSRLHVSAASPKEASDAEINGQVLQENPPDVLPGGPYATPSALGAPGAGAGAVPAATTPATPAAQPARR